MRKLVLILIIFIAVVTFIRAVDNSANGQAHDTGQSEISTIKTADTNLIDDIKTSSISN